MCEYDGLNGAFLCNGAKSRDDLVTAITGSNELIERGNVNHEQGEGANNDEPEL